MEFSNANFEKNLKSDDADFEENTTTILMLDPGTSTGYCLMRISENWKKADIYEYNFLDVDTSSDFQGDHCIDLMKKLQKLIDKHNVYYIGIEDYFFSKRFRQGSTVNAAFRTAIHILARQNDIEYTILSITEWKKYVSGSSKPTKDQIKLWGREPAKKLYIQQALWDWYGFRFPNHSISKATGKPICFRYDICDVVAQAVYYAEILCGVRKTTLSVKHPKDVTFKRLPKKCFVY